MLTRRQDIQLWLELRCDYCCDHGRIHLVHRSHNVMEVCLHGLSDVISREPTFVLRRTRFRREANAADNKAATVAVDSLINYEAVKVSMSPSAT